MGACSQCSRPICSLQNPPSHHIKVMMQALPSFMGMPSQPLPVRPSQRDAAAAPQGRGDPQGAAHGVNKGSTLRQTYNFLGDPEKHPKLVDTSSSSGDGAASTHVISIAAKGCMEASPSQSQFFDCMGALGPDSQLHLRCLGMCLAFKHAFSVSLGASGMTGTLIRQSAPWMQAAAAILTQLIR